MSQRTALIVSAAVTAFVMVVVGGLILAVALPAARAAAPVAEPAAQAVTPLPDVVEPEAAAAAPGVEAAVSPELAANIALFAAPGATLNGTPELVLYQDVLAYEVPLDRGLVYVDANSGDVLANGAAPAFRQHDDDDGFESGEHERGEHSEFGEGGFDD